MNRIQGIRKNVFAKFLFTYICVALVGLILMIPLYQISLSSSRKVVLEEQNKLLEQGFQETVASLESFRQYAYNFSKQTEIRKLAMTGDNDPNLSIYLYHAVQLLQKQLPYNPLDCKLVVTFPKNNAVVTNSRVYTDKEEFYKKFFAYAEMSFADWSKALEECSPGWNGKVMEDRIFYYPAVTYNHYFEEGAVVVSIVVNNTTLLKKTATADILTDGWVEITDKRFGSLISLGETDTEKLPVSASTETSSLIINAGLSSRLVSEGVEPVRMLMLLYIGIALLVFIALSLLFAAGHAKPYMALMGIMKDYLPAETGFSPYEGLQNGVDSIMKSYRKIQSERDDLDRIYRNQLIDMALGGAPVRGDVEKALGELPLLRHYFQVVAVEGTAPLFERLHTLILTQEPGCRFHLFKDTGVLLVPREGDWTPGQLAELLTGGIGEDEQETVHIGVSGIHMGEQELADAYGEASRAMYTAMNSGSVLSVYLPEAMAAPPSVDRSLLWNILLHQQEGEVRGWFESLLSEDGLHGDALAGEMVYYYVLGILRQINLQFLPDFPLPYEPYQRSHSARDNITGLGEWAVRLNASLKTDRPDEKNGVMEAVLSYVQENFRNSSLSLSTLAVHVNLSERYLSALMSEHLGCSYMDYLNKLRMEEASRLLLHSKLSVNEVAQQCGYEYPNTFFKAFRRWSGMTPTQYRKSGTEA